MSRGRAFIVALALIAVFGCVTYSYHMFWMPSIPNHQGDGTFVNLSRRAGPFALPGYSISMAEFDLGKPHRAEYRVGGLTNIRRDCGVYLAIRDHDNRWGGGTGHLDGSLELKLLDSHGQSVVTVVGRLGDYTWWGFSDLHALYQMDKSRFTVDSEEEYRVVIKYLPDPRLAGYKGFVYVRSGGGK
jgi:hypothetical protein